MGVGRMLQGRGEGGVFIFGGDIFVFFNQE